MKIKQFDKALAKRIGEDIEDALKGVAKQYGINVAYRGGRFDAGKFTPRVEFTVADNAQNEWTRWAQVYRLTTTTLGSTFTSKGEMYEVVGILPKRPTRPLLAKRMGDGRQFVFPLRVLPEVIEREAREAVARRAATVKTLKPGSLTEKESLLAGYKHGTGIVTVENVDLDDDDDFVEPTQVAAPKRTYRRACVVDPATGLTTCCEATTTFHDTTEICKACYEAVIH